MCKGIDANKINVLCESIICHYWYFLEINFRFHPTVYYIFHGLRQKKAMSFNDAAVVFVKGNYYRVHF